MATSSVGIYRPAEGDAGGVGHAVDDRPGLDLEERHAAERRGVERPRHRALLEQYRRAGPGAGRPVGSQRVPSHAIKLRMLVPIGQTSVRGNLDRALWPNTAT